MEKLINVLLMSDKDMNDVFEDLIYVNRAIDGDKSPPVYRRLRKLKKTGILTINKGNVRLTTNPLLLASFRIKDLSILIKDFVLLYQGKNGKLHIISSVCGVECSKCPKLRECSQVLKDMYDELNIRIARGITPIEVVRYVMNQCMSNSRLIKININLKYHTHKPNYNGGHVLTKSNNHGGESPLTRTPNA